MFPSSGPPALVKDAPKPARGHHREIIDMRYWSPTASFLQRGQNRRDELGIFWQARYRDNATTRLLIGLAWGWNFGHLCRREESTRTGRRGGALQRRRRRRRVLAGS